MWLADRQCQRRIWLYDQHTGESCTVRTREQDFSDFYACQQSTLLYIWSRREGGIVEWLTEISPAWKAPPQFALDRETKLRWGTVEIATLLSIRLSGRWTLTSQPSRHPPCFKSSHDALIIGEYGEPQTTTKGQGQSAAHNGRLPRKLMLSARVPGMLAGHESR